MWVCENEEVRESGEEKTRRQLTELICLCLCQSLSFMFISRVRDVHYLLCMMFIGVRVIELCRHFGVRGSF